MSKKTKSVVAPEAPVIETPKEATTGVLTPPLADNEAAVIWNEGADRFQAITKHGAIVAEGREKQYLWAVIPATSQKAKKLGITLLRDCTGMTADGVSVNPLMNATPVSMAAGQVMGPRIEDEFGINERFDILVDYVDMVAHEQQVGCVVTGSGGLGKSHTVFATLRHAGKRDVSELDLEERMKLANGFVVIKGYSTPKALYRTLYENKNKIVVFDDCDSVLRDPTAVNILKAALDSYDVRRVSWNTEGFGSADDLPSSFEFEGRVIFITNYPIHKVPQPIRSRAPCADVTMTHDEVVERMRTIVSSEEFLPEFEMQHKLEALEFVAEHAHHPLVKVLNLRSLINTTRTRVAKPDTWRRVALYDLASSSVGVTA
jgi:hypothetical protein